MTQELLSPCCGASLRTYGDNPWEGLVFCIGCGQVWDDDLVWEFWQEEADELGATVRADWGGTQQQLIEIIPRQWDGTWGWQEWIEGDEMPVRTGVGRDGYADADSAIAAAFDVLVAVA